MIPLERRDDAVGPAPRTFAVDVGGTAVKATVLDRHGAPVVGAVRVPTPHPCRPGALVRSLSEIAASMPRFERVSVGFPGVVRAGRVLTAPHLDDPKWEGYQLAAALAQRLGRPVKVRNDSEIHGLGVVAGRGLEMVVTLGTGVGTSLFQDGRPAPHLELAHHPLRGGRTYDQYLGMEALRRVGVRRWNARVRWAVDVLYVLARYDKLYVGGGNAAKLTIDLPVGAVLVSNDAGLSGGARLWDSDAEPPSRPASPPKASRGERHVARRSGEMELPRRHAVQPSPEVV